MGYDLTPKNKKLEGFHLGAFSWGPLLEACGYLWPMAQNGAQWYYDNRIKRIEASLELLKWMVATNITLTLLVLGRLFLVR